MRVLLDAISILRRHVGGKAAIIGKAMGPWTLSYHMAGTQNFLLQVGLRELNKVNKTSRVDACFDRIGEGSVPGRGGLGGLPTHATGNLVSPVDCTRSSLLPFHKELTSSVWLFSLTFGELQGQA